MCNWRMVAGAFCNNLRQTYVGLMWINGRIIIANLFQINQDALDRARKVMRYMKDSVRIFVILMYFNDVRVILVTALQEGMQESKL